MRAGSRALSIFANALNARVLHALAAGPMRPGELERELGWAPQSSLRAAVTTMTELGALARSEPAGESAGTATELTAAGRRLLHVADALERWLAASPGGPMPLEDPAARGIVRVLTAAWDSTVVRALAEQPQTLIELSAGIPDVNYPALKRRLAKLRSTNLAVPIDRNGGTMAYAASEWLRLAVVPLVLAGRWERRHDAGAEPISRVEVEASFLLALPLLGPHGRASAGCALAVLTSENGSRSGREVAGVSIEVERGSIVACRAGHAANPATWALGTADAWFDAVIDGRFDALRIRGAKPKLAEGIVRSLHSTLFKAEQGK